MRDERTALLEVIESFLVQRHDLSSATIDNYRRRLTDFTRWCETTVGRVALVGDLEGGTVDAFLSHLRVTVSGQTARSAWVALRSLAKYLADRRIHHDDGQSVLRLVRMPRVKDEWRRGLTDDEMFRVLEVSSQGELGPRDGAIVLTLLGCGLRRGELVSLCLGDVSVPERRIHIRASSSKSVHPRDVTVPIETLKVLELDLGDYRVGEKDPEAALFTDRRGEALTGNGVRRQRLLDHALDLRAARRFETNEALNQLSIAIIYEGLRDILIITQQLIDQIIIRIGQRILNSELFHKARNLGAIVVATNI